jgi:ribonuclease H2 subunit A
VARDKALKDWEFAESVAGGKSFPQQWGSGYPGDPATKKFLLSTIDPFFGFPSIVRFSWKTAEKLIDEKCVKMLFEEVEPAEDETVKKNPSVKDFFIQAPKKETARGKARCHPYFAERGLSRVGSAALI